jgi:hypothetical protein
MGGQVGIKVSWPGDEFGFVCSWGLVGYLIQFFSFYNSFNAARSVNICVIRL